MPYFLRAIIELGLPVAALSWLLFYRLYSRGDLARDADRKAIRVGLKQIKQASKKSAGHDDSVLNRKWMKFGGGFYGAAAVWTLTVIEVGGIVATITHPPNFKAMFDDGLLRLLIDWLLGQFTTFIDALLWFSWWPDKGHSVWVWVAVAYLGYLAGLELARYETALGSRLVGWDWRAQLRSRLHRHKDG